jgi:teichuronic acid exporter
LNNKEKSAKGILWVLFQRFSQQSLKFVSGIILARLLSPEEFGLMGILNVILAITNLFVESGFSSSLVQKEKIDRYDSNSIFFFNIGIGLGSYFLLWIVAPYIADFYQMPLLIELIRVLALVIIINSFQLIQNAYITRHLNFALGFKSSISGTIIGSIAGISTALNGFGVWSLVLQSLVRVSVHTFVLWYLSTWRPRLIFSLERLKQLFKFGSWVFLEGLFNSIFNNLYTLFIGKQYNAYTLGLYSKSKQINHIPSETIVQAIDNVSFSVLSKYQSEPVKFLNAYRSFLQTTLYIITPLLAFLHLITYPLVELLLTLKWIEMVPILKIFSLVGFLTAVNYIKTRVFLSLGQSRIVFIVGFARNLLRLVNISFYGLSVEQILWGELIIQACVLIVITILQKSKIKYSYTDQTLDIVKFIFSGFLIYITHQSSLYFELYNYYEVLYVVFFGSLMFLAAQYTLNRRLTVDIFKQIKQFLNK